MRPFAKSGFRVWAYSTESKLVYSAFSLFAMAALLVSFALYDDIGNVDGSKLDAYYRGAAMPTADSTLRRGGPSIDMPEEELAKPISVGTSYRKLLEVTHFHLFTMPIFLLVVAHLFLQTGASLALRRGMIVAAFVGAAAHVAAPWAVRAAPGYRWMYMISGTLLLGSVGWMTIHTILSMWLPQRKPPDAA